MADILKKKHPVACGLKIIQMCTLVTWNSVGPPLHLQDEFEEGN